MAPSTDLTSLSNAGAAVESSDDDEDADEKQRRLNIAEAFADDDVVAEFKAKRKSECDSCYCYNAVKLKE